MIVKCDTRTREREGFVEKGREELPRVVSGNWQGGPSRPDGAKCSRRIRATNQGPRVFRGVEVVSEPKTSVSKYLWR